VVDDVTDSLLTPDFYRQLYKNVFFDEMNNLTAGIVGIKDPQTLRTKIEED